MWHESVTGVSGKWQSNMEVANANVEVAENRHGTGKRFEHGGVVQEEHVTDKVAKKNLSLLG
ncbi:MAG TPA: hypothetical protein V6C89_07395 [Drouetiella sp.]|jgi:hypothetical protein